MSTSWTGNPGQLRLWVIWICSIVHSPHIWTNISPNSIHLNSIPNWPEFNPIPWTKQCRLSFVDHWSLHFFLLSSSSPWIPTGATQDLNSRSYKYYWGQLWLWLVSYSSDGQRGEVVQRRRNNSREWEPGRSDNELFAIHISEYLEI